MLMLVVSALLAFNALLLWVATGPRSLASVNPYIESALSSSDGSYSVKIGETRLIWDGWRHPVDIRLNNVKVLTREGKVFTVFPEIAMGVDVLYLPLGRVMLTSLTINAPLMSLVQNDDRTFGFGFHQAGDKQNDEFSSESEPTVPFSVLLASFLSQGDGNNFRRLRSIIIHDARLRVRNSKQAVFFDANDLNIVLNRDRYGKIKVNSSANIHYKENKDSIDYSSSIRTEFLFNPSQTNIEGKLEFSELMPDVLAGMFSDIPDVKSFAVPISGKVNMSLEVGGGVEYAGFEINGRKGNIVSDRLIAKLPVNSLHLHGMFSKNFNELDIDSLVADIDGMQLSAKGEAKFFDTKVEPDASPEISAEIILKDVPSEKVANLWPPALSPMTREWVTGNISGGKILEDKLVLDIKKGDLKKPILPKEAIDANITIEDVNIRYLPEHPPAKRVKGKIHIDGLGLVAEIESADYLEKTKLSQGQVLIEDLNVDNPYIRVDLHADAPAKDMVHFLGLPRLKHAGHLGLKEDTVAGHVKGNAAVGFNFFAPKGQSAEDAIVYDVKAEISGVSQKDFLHKFDIAGASGNIRVNNNGVEFTGTGEVNGAVIGSGNVKYLFKPENNFDTFIEAKASIATEHLKRFGYPEFPFIKGNIGVNAKVKLGDKIEHTEAALDLSDTEVNFNAIGWKKVAKEAANLELVTDKKDGVLKISSFLLTGKKTSAKGTATLSDNFSEISSMHLDQFIVGGSNISNLHYEKNEGGIQVDVEADSVDLTSNLESNSDGFSFANFPAVKLKADIGKLIFGKDRIFLGFKGEILCDKDICNNVKLNGKTGSEKSFSVKIAKDAKNQRQLSVTADDAGAFLHTVGVIDGMNGGKLTLNGNYKESKDGSTLIGKMYITEHTIKDAPLLGKVLSLASLTGFIDALQGNGIRFKELTIPFTLRDDVITLEKGKTYGAAIGITVDGTITFPKKILDLQGTVVPSYTLNNVLGKVPLLGEMLTGGEGQGVFAARYSIKGLESKADVSVNPLSILTPGFLRGLFDIFDDKPAKGKDSKR